jgi:hypothetical protein
VQRLYRSKQPPRAGAYGGDGAIVPVPQGPPPWAGPGETTPHPAPRGSPLHESKRDPAPNVAAVFASVPWGQSPPPPRQRHPVPTGSASAAVRAAQGQRGPAGGPPRGVVADPTEFGAGAILEAPEAGALLYQGICPDKRIHSTMPTSRAMMARPSTVLIETPLCWPCARGSSGRRIGMAYLLIAIIAAAPRARARRSPREPKLTGAISSACQESTSIL